MPVNAPIRQFVNLWSRRLHRWGAIAVLLPVPIVICTGLLLMVKKQFDWIQPPVASSSGGPPSVNFDTLLAAAASVPEAGITGWSDVERVDVRIREGVAKVHSKTHWEVQIDSSTGEVLQTAYRRSDIIEALHDGSWFHPAVKTWIFLPSGVILLGLWATGVYLWILPGMARRRRDARAAAMALKHPTG